MHELCLCWMNFLYNFIFCFCTVCRLCVECAKQMRVRFSLFALNFYLFIHFIYFANILHDFACLYRCGVFLKSYFLIKTYLREIQHKLMKLFKIFSIYGYMIVGEEIQLFDKDWNFFLKTFFAYLQYAWMHW